MGLKKSTVVVPPKKVEPQQKKIVVKTPTKIETKVPEVKTVVPEVKTVVPETVVPKGKKDWDGIGLIGNHADLSKFKGICKMKGMILGKELLTIIREFNSKNS